MRLPVNTVIHTTLVGLEPATFRSLVDCWPDALPVVPPAHQVDSGLQRLADEWIHILCNDYAYFFGNINQLLRLLRSNRYFGSDYY